MYFIFNAFNEGSWLIQTVFLAQQLTKKKVKVKKGKGEKGKGKKSGGDGDDKPPTFKLGTSEVITKFDEFYDEWKVDWDQRDESNNQEQKHDGEKTREDVMPLLEEQFKNDVDEMIKMELENMRTLSGAKSKKKKGKKKKEKASFTFKFKKSQQERVQETHEWLLAAVGLMKLDRPPTEERRTYVVMVILLEDTKSVCAVGGELRI